MDRSAFQLCLWSFEFLCKPDKEANYSGTSIMIYLCFSKEVWSDWSQYIDTRIEREIICPKIRDMTNA